MSRRLRRAFFSLALTPLFACAAEAPRPVAVPPAAPAVAAVAVAPAPPAHVDAPKDLGITTVVAHPRATFDALAKRLDGTPMWRRVASGMGKLQMLAGPELIDAFDVDAPIFLASSGKTEVVISIGLVRGSEPAVRTRLHLDPATDKGDGGLPFTFALVTTPGGVSRLLCSADAPGLAHLGAFVQQMTADPAGPDVHLEVLTEAVREAALTGMRQYTAKAGDGASAGHDFGEKLVGDLVNDLDAFVVDLSFHAATEASYAIRFRSTSSPFSHFLTAHPERVAVAPPAFWRLPESSGLALFSLGSDPADLEPMRAALFPMLGEAIAADNCPDESAYVMDRLKALFLTGGPYVMATGGNEVAAASAVTASQALAHYEGAARAKTRLAIASWFLAEVEEPMARWDGPLRELAQADKKFAGCKKAPKATGTDEKPQTQTSTMSLAPVAASAHLPTGTLHVVNRVTPLAKDGAPAHVVHFYFVPEKTHLWIAFGEDDLTLLARAHDVLEGSPASRTLAVREGLDPLHTVPVLGGGFGTLEGVRFLGLEASTASELAAASATIQAWRALPSKGQSPIVVTWQATPREARANVTLSPVALADLLTLVAP